MNRMRPNLLAFEIVALAFAATPAYTRAVAQDLPQYSPAQVRQMAREARTAQQYGELADYYQMRRRMFVRKAAEEMDEWARRNAVITPLSEKWPRPVDSARNLHDYYVYQAAKSAAASARYSKLADQAAR